MDWAGKMNKEKKLDREGKVDMEGEMDREGEMVREGEGTDGRGVEMDRWIRRKR